MTPLLQARDVSKRFAGVTALSRVSFELRPGEVHALMGENGAGKSTLMNLLSGMVQPDEGQIWWKGRPTRFRSPHAALKVGIAMIHQEQLAFPELTVAENVFMGQQPVLGWFGWVDRKAMRNRARELLERLGLSSPPELELRNLGVAEAQTVAIAKALACKTEVFLMDEPTSALSEREVEALFRVIRELRQRGAAVVYTSHKLREVFAIADRVTVLRDGCWRATHRIGEVDQQKLISLMVGREVSSTREKLDTSKSNVTLAVKDLTKHGKFRDIAFDVKRGEILGIAGLIGAGRTDLAKALFGLAPADSGEIQIQGRSVEIRNPREAMRNGLVMVSEDRKEYGLVPNMPVRENLTLSNLRCCCRGVFIDRELERRVVQQQLGRFGIKVSNLEQAAQTLSGGNQQKLVIAKALLTDPAIVILDEPTRGIDIGAKSDIYGLLTRLALDGKALIVISSELLELLTWTHRILVMCDGTITAELDPRSTTEEEILRYAMPHLNNRAGNVTAPAKRLGSVRKTHWSRFGLLIALAAVFLSLSAATPNFLTFGNLLNVVRQISVNGILAVGATYVLLTGGVDLSLGSVVALASVVSASFAHPGQYPAAVPVLMGGLTGLACGVVNGLVITRAGVAPFIVTLGMMTAARGLALVVSGGKPVSNLSRSFTGIGDDVFGFPVPILLFFVIALGSWICLSRLRFGRYLYAVGGNEKAALASGINVSAVKTFAYTLCGLLAGMAGVVLAARVTTGQPNAGLGYELDAIAAVVIGGTSLSGGVGGVGGTVLGALLMGMLNNGLDLMNVSSYYQQIVKGVLIVGAVCLDRRQQT